MTDGKTVKVGLGLYILNDSIKDRDDIERYLELNTLAEIPIESGKKEKKHRFKKRGGK